VLHISHCRKISNDLEITDIWYSRRLFGSSTKLPYFIATHSTSRPHASVTFAALVRFKYETPLFHRLRTPPHDPHAFCQHSQPCTVQVRNSLISSLTTPPHEPFLSHSQPLFIQYLPRPGPYHTRIPLRPVRLHGSCFRLTAYADRW